MLRIRSNKKLALVISLLLCLVAASTVVLANNVSGQEMVVVYITDNDPAKCRLVVDQSGKEIPCPSSAISGYSDEIPERDAIARHLPYVRIGHDIQAAYKELYRQVDGTRLAELTRVIPTATPYGEKWVVVNGRFEIGDIPLKPNYVTETIVLTEVNAQKYGFTIYVPITTSFEAAQDELMRVLDHPSVSR